MSVPRKIILHLITIGLLSLTTCINKESSKPTLAIKTESEKNKCDDIDENIRTSKSLQIYHYSTANNKKFDHRVSGIDETGNNVTGVINLEGEIAIGLIKSKNGDEIEIVSDQINKNRLTATDVNGFHYKLKVDDK